MLLCNPTAVLLLQLYVIGSSCVLTRRDTITPEVLAAAATAAPSGEDGMVILPRLSANKFAAAKLAQQASQQQQQQQEAQQQLEGSGSGGRGAAVADASVAADPQAPPLWSMGQLAVYLRSSLGMNLFNVDIIAPPQAPPQQQHQHQQQQQLWVVDINYFPGYDKVPGAELLFADFLAQCAAYAGSTAR
jgi:hypothetical protein